VIHGLSTCNNQDSTSRTKHAPPEAVVGFRPHEHSLDGCLLMFTTFSKLGLLVHLYYSAGTNTELKRVLLPHRVIQKCLVTPLGVQSPPKRDLVPHKVTQKGPSSP